MTAGVDMRTLGSRRMVSPSWEASVSSSDLASDRIGALDRIVQRSVSRAKQPMNVAALSFANLEGCYAHYPVTVLSCRKGASLRVEKVIRDKLKMPWIISMYRIDRQHREIAERWQDAALVSVD